MKYLLSVTMTILGLITICNGSGYGEVHFDSMSISSKSNKLDIAFQNLVKGKLTVEVKVDDKIIPVDLNFLWGAQNIQRSSVKVKVGPMKPTDPPKKSDDIGFYLTFEFGGTYDHGTHEKEVQVMQFVRLYFKNGKFEFSELYKPLGEHKNKWEVFDKWSNNKNNSKEHLVIDAIDLYDQ